jgi:hypothetical protein
MNTKTRTNSKRDPQEKLADVQHLKSEIVKQIFERLQADPYVIETRDGQQILLRLDEIIVPHGIGDPAHRPYNLRKGGHLYFTGRGHVGGKQIGFSYRLDPEKTMMETK